MNKKKNKIIRGIGNVAAFTTLATCAYGGTTLGMVGGAWALSGGDAFADRDTRIINKYNKLVKKTAAGFQHDWFETQRRRSESSVANEQSKNDWDQYWLERHTEHLDSLWGEAIEYVNSGEYGAGAYAGGLGGAFAGGVVGVGGGLKVAARVKKYIDGLCDEQEV